jgi:hypothetical protein
MHRHKPRHRTHAVKAANIRKPDPPHSVPEVSASMPDALQGTAAQNVAVATTHAETTVS